MSVQRPSPGFMPNCFSATRFHLVAACTTWASIGCLSWSFVDVELDRRARAVAIEHVVDAALDVHDQRNRHHHQVQFLAKILLDVALRGKDGLLRFLDVQQGPVIIGQNLFQFVVVSDARPRQIRFLVSDFHQPQTSTFQPRKEKWESNRGFPPDVRPSHATEDRQPSAKLPRRGVNEKGGRLFLSGGLQSPGDGPFVASRLLRRPLRIRRKHEPDPLAQTSRRQVAPISCPRSSMPLATESKSCWAESRTAIST